MKKKDFISREITIGRQKIGGLHPVLLQSMTNTSTCDVAATVEQIIRLSNVGCEMVRFSVPAMRDVRAVIEIKNLVRQKGIDMPLVADVHFQPAVAEALVGIVDKIRVNPGNYSTDNHEKNGKRTFNDSFETMKEKARSLLQLCDRDGTALRIGVNHGSLSHRIVERYGNGAEALCASAMEWVKICQDFNFQNVVFSMKASNVLVMIQATWLLAEQMRATGQCYPLHLGVTEAGSGLDGRVKSAAGIGALLLRGLGDTLRVSLTEKPENEILFAKKMLQAIETIDVEKYPLDTQGRLVYESEEQDREQWIAAAAALSGYYHSTIGIRDIWISNPFFSLKECKLLANAILQACRVKMSYTEIISCPTCARTIYDLENAVEKVKRRFINYPGLKIAVMGCVVNGPGEMADADYGIVGSSKNKVVVYKGKERISSNVSLEEALTILETLIH
ncbi:MAG: (E)-4-hydroxy-3-methylbut-2-enyl-diphosphate synthase [Bacteroidales bacterium]|nr:(E)-4-hydroxy-3-methylbut-2-enyl-diphosphate synthase [Bacteroidales bacterium]